MLFKLEYNCLHEYLCLFTINRFPIKGEKSPPHIFPLLPVPRPSLPRQDKRWAALTSLWGGIVASKSSDQTQSIKQQNIWYRLHGLIYLRKRGSKRRSVECSALSPLYFSATPITISQCQPSQASNNPDVKSNKDCLNIISAVSAFLFHLFTCHWSHWVSINLGSESVVKQSRPSFQTYSLRLPNKHFTEPKQTHRSSSHIHYNVNSVTSHHSSGHRPLLRPRSRRYLQECRTHQKSRRVIRLRSWGPRWDPRGC